LYDQFLRKLEIQSELKDLIIEAILNNTDVRMENSEYVYEPGQQVPGISSLFTGKRTEDKMDYVWEPKGQYLEVGLIQFLIDNEMDVQQRFIERNKHSEKLIQLPFDQNLKRKTVVRRMQNDKTKCRVYVKGAPEYIFALCNQTLNHNLD